MNSELSRMPEPGFAGFPPLRSCDQRASEAIVRRYLETGLEEINVDLLEADFWTGTILAIVCHKTGSGADDAPEPLRHGNRVGTAREMPTRRMGLTPPTT